MLEPASEDSDGRLLREAADELERAREDVRVAEQEVTAATVELDDLRTRLEQLELVLHAVVDAVGDVVIAVDAHLEVIVWGRVAEAVFSATAAHALGRPLAHSAPAELVEAVRLAADGGPAGAVVERGRELRVLPLPSATNRVVLVLG